MSALRSKNTRNNHPPSRVARVNGAGGSPYIAGYGPFILTVESVWRVRGGFDRIRYSKERSRGSERASKEQERKRVEMRFDGKNFKFEMLLEAPVWLLVTAALLVTVAVIASAVSL